MSLLYLGNALSGLGNTPTSADIVPGLLRKEGLEVAVASSKKNILLRMLDMLWGIVRHAGSVDYVLIDTYSTKNFCYAYFCSQLCRLYRLKYIPILHGGSLPQRMDRSPVMTKAIFGNSFRNIAPSGYLLEALACRGFTGELIPNTIPVGGYTFKLRDKVRPKLLYVRAFARLYNPQMALHVLKELLSDHPDAQLCMVGPDKDGTLEACRILARDLGVEDKVKFPGKLSKEAWHKLSGDCDIFINTSNKDNTPVSVIEAMALGLPVVSTNPGGMPYLVDDAKDGLLVGLDDADAMAAQIRYLVQNPDKAVSLACAARSKVEGFDWEQVKLLWKELL